MSSLSSFISTLKEMTVVTDEDLDDLTNFRRFSSQSQELQSNNFFLTHESPRFQSKVHEITTQRRQAAHIAALAYKVVQSESEVSDSYHRFSSVGSKLYGPNLSKDIINEPKLPLSDDKEKNIKSFPLKCSNCLLQSFQTSPGPGPLDENSDGSNKNQTDPNQACPHVNNNNITVEAAFKNLNEIAELHKALSDDSTVLTYTQEYHHILQQGKQLDLLLDQIKKQDTSIIKLQEQLLKLAESSPSDAQVKPGKSKKMSDDKSHYESKANIKQKIESQNIQRQELKASIYTHIENLSQALKIFVLNGTRSLLEKNLKFHSRALNLSLNYQENSKSKNSTQMHEQIENEVEDEALDNHHLENLVEEELNNLEVTDAHPNGSNDPSHSD